MKYLVGSRGSRLSTTQTNYVINELKVANPESDYEITSITTKGDTDSRPLFTIDQKGIFEKEIDKAVIEKRVDFAVHSLKDVPSSLPNELFLACVPKRGTINDVLISKNGISLDSLPPNSLVGTSSLRRAVQITRKRSDVIVKPIRGNIETRINNHNYDAVILASAGITRLKLDVKHVVLSVDDFVPSPGQGALAIIARKDNHRIISMLKKIEDLDSRLEVEAERTLSSKVDSGCRFPIGAYAVSDGDLLTLHVAAFSVDGSKSIIVKKTGPKSDPVSLGESTSKELCKRGIDDLALNWREKVMEWNKNDR